MVVISKWRWLLRQLTRRLWVRAAALGVAGVATALLAVGVERKVPYGLPSEIGAEAVDGILHILASSMLAVTTFSLSVMVAAYSAATNSVSPRATKLLMEDPTTQNVLATFIGSFLFSLVGLVALSTGAYGDSGRAVLFAVTIVVIVLIVVTLLRWIEHLSRLGRVGETSGRVETAAGEALAGRAANPHLGAQPLVDVPPGGVPVFPQRAGYVQHIDVAALSRVAGEHGDVYVTSMPGAFVHGARALAHVARVDDDTHDAIRDAFTIGAERSYDQDPRFGLSVLAEIASRALSPAVNDPGTAIDVIGRAVRLLSDWKPDAQAEIVHRRVWMPPLRLRDLFDDVFGPIARDGASLVEVQIRLQKALHALAEIGGPQFREQAQRHSALAMKHAESSLVLEEDKAKLRELAARLSEL